MRSRSIVNLDRLSDLAEIGEAIFPL